MVWTMTERSQDVSVIGSGEVAVTSTTDGATERLDVDAKSKIWDGTNEVDVVLDSGLYRLAVDAVIQGSASGITGDDTNFHTEDIYSASEVMELWNYVVPSGKEVFIHAMGASSNKAGASKSKVDLIARVTGPTDTDKAGFFFDNAHQRQYPKAIKFVYGETIILEVTNAAGANNEIEVTINAVEVDV